MTLEFLKGLSLIQNKRNLLAGEVFYSKQVLQTLQHVFPLMRFLRASQRIAGLFKERDLRERRVPRHQFPLSGLPLFRYRSSQRLDQQRTLQWAFHDGRDRSARRAGCAWAVRGRRGRSWQRESCV